MNSLINNRVDPPEKSRTGGLRVVVLALAFFLMGIAAGALWFARPSSPNPPLEQARESDLTHALAGSAPIIPQPQPASPPQPARRPDPAAVAAVKRLIPNVESASLERGTQILRQTALAEFQEAAQDFQARQEKAEQNVLRAQNSRSAEQEQVAIQELRHLQTEQMKKLQQIAARSKVQVETLEQLKGATP